MMIVRVSWIDLGPIIIIIIIMLDVSPIPI